MPGIMLGTENRNVNKTVSLPWTKLWSTKKDSYENENRLTKITVKKI